VATREVHAIIERMNHDYKAHSFSLGRGKGWNVPTWARPIPGHSNI
jgi:hypothetical protein